MSSQSRWKQDYCSTYHHRAYRAHYRCHLCGLPICMRCATMEARSGTRKVRWACRTGAGCQAPPKDRP